MNVTKMIFQPCIICQAHVFCSDYHLEHMEHMYCLRVFFHMLDLHVRLKLVPFGDGH